MKRTSIKYIFLSLAFAVSAITLLSCQDDLFYSNGHPVEGLPATIHVKLEIEDMDQMTRALVDEDGANYCENVWVGVYRVSDGKRLFSNLYTSPSNTNEETDVHYRLGDLTIETESGESRIVAVANVNSCEGLSDPTNSNAQATKLGTLLDNATTWDAFTSICAMRTEPTNIYQLTYDLTMSGYYSESGDTDYKKTSVISDNEDDNIPTVDIVEGENELTGTIKLRRLISYNKFNISAGENINMSLVSWQVCNNPYYSYVLEAGTNAGDDYEGSETPYNPALATTVFVSETDGSQSFDFYQYENKHTACKYTSLGTNDWVGIRENASDVNDYYNDREREYKDTYSNINRTIPAADGEYETNTGVYKSLVKDVNDETWMDNNNASYVVIKATISYYFEDTSYNREHPDEAIPEPEGYNGHAQIFRTAEATYTIHLGYCEYKNGTSPTRDTAMDFNCRRNSRYTYNVTIEGVNNIVVEAKKQGEEQSGAEGTVYDSYGEYIQLDSHYNTFNISLSNSERNSLKYHIVAPYNGSNNYIFSETLTDAEKTSLDDNEFYSWIKFKPTESEDKFAVYNDGTATNDLWSLEDLKNVAEHPGNNGSTSTLDETQQWYTVFIDEYVYHNGEQGDNLTGYNETSWKTYTNQDDRKVEFIVSDNLSSDSNSDYLLCKYAFTQRSIQSYYDGNLSDTGFGVEHTNESFGLNFRWYGGKYDGWSAYNGRYNLNLAAGSSTWDNVIDQTKPDEIAAGGNNNYFSHPAASYPVPQLKPIANYSTKSVWDPSIDDSNFYDVKTACMNRNRDLNGDGKIDQNEMRWYLPTYNQYSQIMVGLSGLVSPLIDWNKYSKSRYFDTQLSTEYRSEFHFVGSDGGFIWVEEGFSQATNVYSSLTLGGYVPYEIRCIRNLGDNPGTTPTVEAETNEAYHINSENPYIIEASYYTDKCIRSYTSSYLAPHAINSEANKVYRKIEVAKNVSKDWDDGILYGNSYGNVGERASTPSGLDANKYVVSLWYKSLSINGPCRQYTQDEDSTDMGHWRVPNIKEVAMMKTIGTTELANSGYTLSGTHEYFIDKDLTEAYYNRYYFFGNLSGKIARSVLANVSNLNSSKVRCVRDIR